MGRTSKYDTNVKQYLDKVREWKRNGATNEQIAERLDISLDAFYNYLNEKADFYDAIKKSKIDFVNELKNNLAEIARKHSLKITKTYIKEENGKKIKTVEITEKEVDADPAAIQILLKNIDRDNWADNPQALELKRQELELKKMLAEANNWDLSNV